MIKVVFAGTPAFSQPCLNALIQHPDIDVVGVVSQPDRRSGRGMKYLPSPIKKVALQHQIKCITPESIKDNQEAESWLLAMQPDILVVVAFGMLLPLVWLQIPKLAAINVHASLLPRWRGAAPIERAMLAGDQNTGVCIMKMEEGLDTGGIYACHPIPIEADTNGAKLWQLLSETGAKLLINTLLGIASGTLKAVEQDHAKASYAAKIHSADRIIDWSQPAHLIDRQVRCFSPKPSARTRYANQWLKIIRGIPVKEHSTNPTGWINIHDRYLDVSCGEQTVYRILQVQVEGKKAMDTDAFLNGFQIHTGDMLVSEL